MYFNQHVTICLTYFFLLAHTLPSAPAHSVSLERPIADQVLASDVQNPFNLSIIDSTSSLANHSTNLQFTTVIWSIADTTLFLKANIGPWRYTRDRILETLEAAATAVGKKPAEGLVDKKFVQEQGSRINTMLFEIGPGFIAKRLTWEDVGNVLSVEKGLPKFYEKYGVWTSTYFEVRDTVRGELGGGAVRKWYHLAPPIGDNGTAGGGESVDMA